MSAPKKNINKEIIALFSGQSSTITTPKLYIQLTGSYALASVLNQAVFWSNKSKCDNDYFYKTYKEWFEEIHIPERTLRRYLDKLEFNGWIHTKVKKVNGKNTKHIQPDMDKIIDSISSMLNTERPIRPTCPDGGNNEQKPCTKTAPTGHIGRSEPANLSVSEGSISLYTEDYIQKKLTNCEISSSSFFFSETLDRQMLNEKLLCDSRTDEEFLEEVLDHIENRSDKEFPLPVRQQAALRLLRKCKKLNTIFQVAGKKLQEVKPKNIETEAQRQERWRQERIKNMGL